MKKIFLALILMSVGLQVAHADGSTLAQLLSEKAKEAKAGSSIGLVDGVPGAVTYLPIKTLVFGGVDWAEAAVGGEFRSGEKGRPILFPTLNIVALSHLVTVKPQWAKDHIRSSLFPPIFIGIGPVLPLDYQELKRWKSIDLRNGLRAIVSVRFDIQIKE